MPNQPKSRSPVQEREEAEPSEHSRPIPLIVVLITLAVVLSGAVYILLSDSFGPPGLGDRRTVADLRPATVRPGQGADGQQIYNANCVACHQASGKGLPGVFPPLDGSEWVNGNERILVNIVLHGVNGEMNVMGQTYKGAMPSFGHLGDAELVAVLNHVRGAWTNKSAPLQVELIERERKTTARKTPFSGGEELKALAAEKP